MGWLDTWAPVTERTRGFLILLASVLAVLCAVLLIVLLSKDTHSKPEGGVTSPRYKINDGNVVDNWVVFQVRTHASYTPPVRTCPSPSISNPLVWWCEMCGVGRLIYIPTRYTTAVTPLGATLLRPRHTVILRPPQTPQRAAMGVGVVSPHSPSGGIHPSLCGGMRRVRVGGWPPLIHIAHWVQPAKFQS